MFGLRKKKNTRTKRASGPQMSLLKKQLLIGFALFFCIGLILLAVWYGTRINSLQIDTVEVVGGVTISHDQVEDIANTALNGNYLALIPKRFAFLYPESEITKNILTIDRIKNVQVKRVTKKKVLVVFEEYDPYALWCSGLASNNCLFMDTQGYAFARAPELTGSAFVRYVKDDEVPGLETQYFTKSFIEETNNFIELLEQQLSLFVTHVHKIGDYDIEYYIAGGGVIKISQTLPMEVSFNNLQTVLASDDFSHITPGAFQYIDLRFGDKVFVNEVLEEDLATTTATSSNSL